MSSNNRLTQALTYARMGWRVFPVYTIRNGRCACGNPDCGNPGKHPMVGHGVLDATIEEERIRSWWTSCPDANIAIATGSESGIVALDVDPRHSGNESLKSIEEKYGKLPETVQAITGGGGSHFYFRHPGNGTVIKNAANIGKLPGIDFKGDNGYVIAPGSEHMSGSAYEWKLSSSPDLVELAVLPGWLLNLTENGHHSKEATGPKNEPGWVLKALQGVPEGQRNDTAAKLAGYFRNRITKDVAYAILLPWANRCDPPLSESILAKTIDSIYRYPTIEETEAEDETLSPSPVLSEDVWRGLFSDYRDLVSNTTEAPDSYHYASFALVFGATLARRLHVYHARELYPNFYICIVGRSSVARKDTAWGRGRKLLEKLHTPVNESNDLKFQILPGIGSAEGLLDALAGSRKVVILNESEFLSLMGKARQEGLSNLIPKLTSLYDCPDYETLKTRQKSVESREPFLSIFSGTTHSWLKKAISEKEIFGGFANRFMFVGGDPKGPMPFPDKVDPIKQAEIISSINDIRLWAEEVRESTEGEITVPVATKNLFIKFYESYHKRCALDTINSALIARVQMFIWKLSLLYAAMDFSTEILPIHLETALAAGDFLERSIVHTFEAIISSKDRDKEAKLLSFLKEEGGLAPKRETYRKLHLSAREIEAIAKPLIDVGIMKLTSGKGKKGRKIPCYEVVK